MTVGHHRGHAGQLEVERRHLVPQVPHERQDEAAERRVDVERQPLSDRELAECLDRVEQAEAPRRGAGHQADGVGCDRPLDVLDARPEVIAHRDLDQPDAHELRPSRNEKCMVTGAMISGAARPPRLRISRSAARFDSVPPVVITPAPSGAPRSDAIIRTASRSSASVPVSDSSAHSTKNVPWVSASTRRLMGCGIPE